ncbi:uncharacterized protein [Choristoneura fumiferana]|uniref:uncharacterized protein n=1 Tax=Choristoneura fumiferana TaxID=7141 RepID=UPI003D156B6B
MDKKSKAKLVKSKSSNSAITSRSEKGSSNKKSRSNVEFKALAGKKRGVYVEKRPSGNKQINAQDKNETKLKAPPRSRPGTKTFLASVLTILSKSTASTQYPPIQEPKEAKQRNKQRKISKQTLENQKQPPENQKTKMLKKNSLKNVLKDEITIKKVEEYQETNKKIKKTKYKSRVLNEVSNQPSQKVLVLQSKKDIVQTPSCNSKSTKEMSEHSIKWADFLPKLIDSETGAIKNVLEKNYNPQEHGIAKSVLEGTQFNMDKKPYDPTTLVSTPPKDEKLYSLFVDLLESVYNVKPEYNDVSGLKSIKSSKIELEIDDSVAQKLDKPNKIPESIEDDHHIAAKPHYSVTPDDNEDWDTQKLAEYFKNKPMCVEWSEPYLRTKKTCKCVKKKLKTELYATKQKAAKTQSAVMEERRSFYKKTKKPDLLNILKEQLKMDDGGREHTDNFYQSLRVIARNKRKQNTISFNTSVKGGQNAGSDYDSCIFKRRKVISPSTRLPKRNKGNKTNDFFRIPIDTKSVDSEYNRTIAESAINCNESNHSLEVTGFDYEPRTGLPATNKSSMYSNSASESLFDDDSKITNWNLGFRTMTQMWNP